MSDNPLPLQPESINPFTSFNARQIYRSRDHFGVTIHLKVFEQHVIMVVILENLSLLDLELYRVKLSDLYV